MFNVPEIPMMSCQTSSITNSENMSKYSSSQGMSELPPQTAPLTFAPAQQQSAPVSFPPQQQQKQQQQKQQQQQRPVSFPPQQQQQPPKAAPASYPPKAAAASYPPQQAPVSFPPQQAPVSFPPQSQEFQQNFHQQQTQLQQQQHNLQQNQNQQQQFNQYQQSSSTVTSMTSKTYQQTSSSSSSSTTAKTFMPQIVKTLPQTMSPKSPIQRNDAISPRSGMNASPVTPGILKMQIKLDAAVPVPPGTVVNGNGNANPNALGTNGRSSTGGKSPVPFLNTAPAPFGFPALSVQTPETIAQLAPSPSPLVPQYQNPKPLPLITNTEIPNYSSNYNTAARPFGQCKDYYRPIHMEEAKKMHPPVIYTDF